MKRRSHWQSPRELQRRYLTWLVDAFLVAEDYMAHYYDEQMTDDGFQNLLDLEDTALKEYHAYLNAYARRLCESA